MHWRRLETNVTIDRSGSGAHFRSAGAIDLAQGSQCILRRAWARALALRSWALAPWSWALALGSQASVLRYEAGLQL